MKKLLFWIVLIVGIVALIGSCAKKSDTSSTTTPTTYVTTDTGASGSITVGSETMSGTYVSQCMTSVASMISGGALPSDTKGWGGAIIVTGNDNVTEEKGHIQIRHALLHHILLRPFMITFRLVALQDQTIL